MLSLMSEVFKIVLDRYRTNSFGANYNNIISILEWRIREYPFENEATSLIQGNQIYEDCRTLELSQLALLVYLERMSRDFPRESKKILPLVRRAFELFAQADSMQRQFPLLILGREARTDEDRIIVLDLITRTEEKTPIRNLGGVKSLIQSLWAQDDLAEQELGYAEKMRAVLSSRATLMAFV